MSIHIPKDITSLQITVIPNKRKTDIIAYDNKENHAKIELHAKPKQGEANEELISFLQKYFHKEIKLVSGKTMRKKIVKIL